MPRGKLIALEGIDGAGTTTQAKLLVEWMNGQGLQAHPTCEPSDGPIGQLLRALLRRELRPVDPAALALLFAGDRVDHIRSEIDPRLERGVHVVTDRYVYSSLAYQSIDQDLGWVGVINSLAPEPDLTCYLRVDAQLAGTRRRARGALDEIFDADRLQQLIASKYDDFFGSSPTSDPAPDPPGSAWIQLDPAGSGAGSRAGSRRILVAGRRPRSVVLDGSLDIDTLQGQLRKWTQIICALKR